jgi:hypothetical protein
VITLDCESRDSALTSLSAIYGVSIKEVEQFLQETNLEKHYAEVNPPRPGSRELLLLFKREFACSSASIDRVFWFYLTRAKAGSDFAISGILPLTQAIGCVWETILAVFKGTQQEQNLRKLKDNGVPDDQYNYKVGQPQHAGPYAMLVRDSASRAQEMSNHDYLQLPEIMEDICNGYFRKYGEMIDGELRQALTPYIVKFWSNQTGEYLVESALFYLYCIAHAQPLSIDANHCFDGQNSPIPREQIVKIEPFL